MGSPMPLSPFEFAAPTRKGTWERQGLGLVNRAGNGPGQAIGGGHADLDSVAKFWDLPRHSGRRGKNRVAVQASMRGPKGPRHAVMRHDGKTLGFGFGQGRVGRDDGNGRIFRRVALDAKVERVCWPGRGQAEAAKLAMFFIGGRPRNAALRRSSRGRAR